MRSRDKQILEKILSKIVTLYSFIDGKTEADFLDEEIMQYAVSMVLLNIGELVKALSDDIRNKYTDVPWRSIAGLRDIAAHKYETLNMRDVWKTVEVFVPELEQKIEHILASEEMEK